jgi:hypothetical protein
MTRLLMYNEFERIWKEAVVAKFKVISGRSPGGTEESHEQLKSGSPSLIRDLNPVSL